MDFLYTYWLKHPNFDFVKVFSKEAKEAIELFMKLQEEKKKKTTEVTSTTSNPWTMFVFFFLICKNYFVWCKLS